MSIPVVAAVAVGAAVGAPLRLVVERTLTHASSALPWGTLLVNVVGSLILGLLTGVARRGGVDPWVVALIGTGFCGALTTFSGFAAQVAQLTAPSRGTRSGRGVGYAALSVLLGVTAAGAGYLLTR